MRIRRGVNLDHASPEILRACAEVDEVFREYGLEAEATSGLRAGGWLLSLLHGLFRDKKREKRAGYLDAIDFVYPPPALSVVIIGKIRDRLAKPHGDFDVLDERTNASAIAAGVGSQWTGAHLHIEYDPFNPGLAKPHPPEA